MSKNPEDYQKVMKMKADEGVTNTKQSSIFLSTRNPTYSDIAYTLECRKTTPSTAIPYYRIIE